MRMWKRISTSVCAMLALAGCEVLRDQASGTLEVREARVIVAADGAELDMDLDCRLNGPMSDALEHGIPITLQIELHARSAQLRLSDRRAIELRYFPLSRRYQLRDLRSDSVSSFSAFGSLIDALATLRLPLPATFVQLPVGTELRVAVGLDHSALPGPLRLPAILEPAWRLVAPEYAWTIAAG